MAPELDLDHLTWHERNETKKYERPEPLGSLHEDRVLRIWLVRAEYVFFVIIANRNVGDEHCEAADADNQEKEPQYDLIQ